MKASPQSGPSRPSWWTWSLLPLFIYLLLPEAPGSIPWMRSQLSEETERLARLRVGLDELHSEQESLIRRMGTTAPLAEALRPTARTAKRRPTFLSLSGAQPTGRPRRSASPENGECTASGTHRPRLATQRGVETT